MYLRNITVVGLLALGAAFRVLAVDLPSGKQNLAARTNLEIINPQPEEFKSHFVIVKRKGRTGKTTTTRGKGRATATTTAKASKTTPAARTTKGTTTRGRSVTTKTSTAKSSVTPKSSTRISKATSSPKRITTVSKTSTRTSTASSTTSSILVATSFPTDQIESNKLPANPEPGIPGLPCRGNTISDPKNPLACVECKKGTKPDYRQEKCVPAGK